jgi:hypothetical protein
LINSDDPQIRLALSVPSDAHPMVLQKDSLPLSLWLE